MKTKPIGTCAICSLDKELTHEHIPPQSVGNTKDVRPYGLFDSLLKNQSYDDKTGLKWDGGHQNGFKKNTLCESCNPRTGSWYGVAFRDFIDKIRPIVTVHNAKPGQVAEGIIKDIYPLRIIKQILSMFCSINNLDTGIDDLRKFVYEKEASLKLDDMRVYMYIQPYNDVKIIPFQTQIISSTDRSKLECMSEICYSPFGFILSCGIPRISNELVDISEFTEQTYDCKCVWQATIPVKERNLPFVGDFRSKDEIASRPS